MFGFNSALETDVVNGAFSSGTQLRQNELMSYPRFMSCSGSMFENDNDKSNTARSENSLISLQEVLLSRASKEIDQPEYYTMTYLDEECNGGKPEI